MTQRRTALGQAHARSGYHVAVLPRHARPTGKQIADGIYVTVLPARKRRP